MVALLLLLFFTREITLSNPSPVYYPGERMTIMVDVDKTCIPYLATFVSDSGIFFIDERKEIAGVKMISGDIPKDQDLGIYDLTTIYAVCGTSDSFTDKIFTTMDFGEYHINLKRGRYGNR